MCIDYNLQIIKHSFHVLCFSLLLLNSLKIGKSLQQVSEEVPLSTKPDTAIVQNPPVPPAKWSKPANIYQEYDYDLYAPYLQHHRQLKAKPKPSPKQAWSRYTGSSESSTSTEGSGGNGNNNTSENSSTATSDPYCLCSKYSVDGCITSDSWQHYNGSTTRALVASCAYPNLMDVSCYCGCSSQDSDQDGSDNDRGKPLFWVSSFSFYLSNITLYGNTTSNDNKDILYHHVSTTIQQGIANMLPSVDGSNSSSNYDDRLNVVFSLLNAWNAGQEVPLYPTMSSNSTRTVTKDNGNDTNNVNVDLWKFPHDILYTTTALMSGLGITRVHPLPHQEVTLQQLDAANSTHTHDEDGCDTIYKGSFQVISVASGAHLEALAGVYFTNLMPSTTNTLAYDLNSASNDRRLTDESLVLEVPSVGSVAYSTAMLYFSSNNFTRQVRQLHESKLVTLENGDSYSSVLYASLLREAQMEFATLMPPYTLSRIAGNEADEADEADEGVASSGYAASLCQAMMAERCPHSRDKHIWSVYAADYSHSTISSTRNASRRLTSSDGKALSTASAGVKVTFYFVWVSLMLSLWGVAILYLCVLLFQPCGYSTHHYGVHIWACLCHLGSTLCRLCNNEYGYLQHSSEDDSGDSNRENAQESQEAGEAGRGSALFATSVHYKQKYKVRISLLYSSNFLLLLALAIFRLIYFVLMLDLTTRNQYESFACVELAPYVSPSYTTIVVSASFLMVFGCFYPVLLLLLVHRRLIINIALKVMNRHISTQGAHSRSPLSAPVRYSSSSHNNDDDLNRRSREPSVSWWKSLSGIEQEDVDMKTRHAILKTVTSTIALLCMMVLLVVYCLATGSDQVAENTGIIKEQSTGNGIYVLYTAVRYTQLICCTLAVIFQVLMVLPDSPTKGEEAAASSVTGVSGSGHVEPRVHQSVDDDNDGDAEMIVLSPHRAGNGHNSNGGVFGMHNLAERYRASLSPSYTYSLPQDVAAQLQHLDEQKQKVEKDSTTITTHANRVDEMHYPYPNEGTTTVIRSISIKSGNPGGEQDHGGDESSEGYITVSSEDMVSMYSVDDEESRGSSSRNNVDFIVASDPVIMGWRRLGRDGEDHSDSGHTLYSATEGDIQGTQYSCMERRNGNVDRFDESTTIGNNDAETMASTIRALPLTLSAKVHDTTTWTFLLLVCILNIITALPSLYSLWFGSFIIYSIVLRGMELGAFYLLTTTIQCSKSKFRKAVVRAVTSIEGGISRYQNQMILDEDLQVTTI